MQKQFKNDFSSIRDIRKIVILTKKSHQEESDKYSTRQLAKNQEGILQKSYEAGIYSSNCQCRLGMEVFFKKIKQTQLQVVYLCHNDNAMHTDKSGLHS